MLYNIGYLRLGGPNRLTGGGGPRRVTGGGGHGPPGLYVKKGSGESIRELLGKNSKLRLVAINQQYYCNGRQTRNRKVHMTATIWRRTEQNIGGGGAPTIIFRRRRRGKIFRGGGGAARPA
jgi:hypothetical protein